MKFQKAFTLIELAIVIIVLGILTAIAVPKFLDVKSNAITAAKQANEAATKSAFNIYMAKNSGVNPDVKSLADTILGGVGVAVAGGVKYTLGDGTTSTIVSTYTDDGCSDVTTGTTDLVKCVGTYSG